MSGDYSRWSFDPWRDFSAVLMQQGRVHTDADWNEWVTTVLRRVQAGALDTLGRAVVPRETPSGFLIQAAGGGLTIGPGRIYVDGLLAENHGRPPIEFDPRLTELRGTAATPYTAQPYYPNAPALPAGGPHLVYLKVWQREVTFIEDPRLVEPALGVDTTTRLQTAWQVRVLPNVGAAVTCATPLADVPGFTAAEPAASGRLSSGTADVPGEPDPCLVPPSGDYKGENQLFHVEIHRGGDFGGADQASFKWSRDNATVASRIPAIPSLDTIVVESVGRDALLRFSDGDWIEITDDVLELSGLPGEMRRIRSGGGVDDTTRTILLETALPAGRFPVDGQGRTTPSRNTRVRRWDQSGRVLDANGALLVDLNAAGSNGTIPVLSSATSVLLENGAVVRFHLTPAAGVFRTGDYWTFAARSTNASVEILDQAPPRGVHAHYTKLALVTFPEAETDCRTLWPPEVHEGCDCTVCVTAEGHKTGAQTLQHAIDAVKKEGGTICLGPGIFTLRDPLKIVDAWSVRIRGQGPATQIVLTAPGTAVLIDDSVGVTLDSLAVLAPGARDGAGVISVRTSYDVSLHECTVKSLAGDLKAGPAVTLGGVVVSSTIRGCYLVAGVGLAAGEKEHMSADGLIVEDNTFQCDERAVSLERMSVIGGEMRLVGNRVEGCTEVGFLCRGAVVKGGTLAMVGNTLAVAGTGIAVGMGGARIAANEVRAAGRSKLGDGIVFMTGLDPSGLTHLQVIGNRVTGLAGDGIAIRTHVEGALIKQNILADLGGTGLVVEEGGKVGTLAVENNHVVNVFRGRDRDAVVAMRLVGVDRLVVSHNLIREVGRTAVQSSRRAAIELVAPLDAQISGNHVEGVGPPGEFIGDTAGIHLIGVYREAQIDHNSVRRELEAEEKLGPGRWRALGVEEQAPGPIAFGGKVAWVGSTKIGLLLNGWRVIAFPKREASLAVRHNVLDARESFVPAVEISGTGTALLAENHCWLVPARHGRGPVVDIRGLHVSAMGNRLRAPGDTHALHVQGGAYAVVGNLISGSVMVDGQVLPQPWSDLNPQVP